MFYRLRTDPQLVMWVIVLVAHGCPLQANVAAFGFDELTVKDWVQKPGSHCQGVHQRDLELLQILANQIRAVALCRSLLLAVDGLPG